MICRSSLISLLLLLASLLPLSTACSETLLLDLETSIEIAIKNNPQLEIVRQQLAGSEALVQQYKSLYWPHLSAGGDYGRTHVNDLKPVDEDNVGSLLLGVTQLIYDFGRTTGLIDAGRFSRDAVSENLKQNYHDIILDVKRSYYSVLESKELIGVAQQAVENYQDQLYRAQKYLKAGVRTRIDVTNAEVNLSNQRLLLLQAKADFTSARVRFEQVLGIRPNGGDYMVGSNTPALESLVNMKPEMPGPLSELLDTAEQNRPGLQQFTYLIQAADAQITQAQGDYWPVLSASGGYQNYETDLATLNDQWQIGVGLTWEFFSGFETEAKVAEAKASMREVSASLRQFNLSVIQEVTDSFNRADENRASVDIAGQSLGLAAENLTLAEKRYQSGLGDLLEFNDAQLLYTQNQTSLVVAYYGYLTTLAQIERAVGVVPELAGFDYLKTP